MVRLRKQPRSWTIRKCYAEDNAKSVTWTESPKLLLLAGEWLMELGCRPCRAPHWIHSLYLKGSRVGNTFPKECFIFPWATPEEVIFGTKVTSWFARCIWRIATTYALQFSYHYNQSSRCSKLPNETFCNVISAICQRTWRVWMWWLMSIWSRRTQRKAEWRSECSKEGDLTPPRLSTNHF